MIRRPPRSTLFPHDALPISEPRRRIGERLRHARAVGLLAEKQAVQVGVEEAGEAPAQQLRGREVHLDRKSTRLNSSHGYISYAVFCLKKKKNILIAGDVKDS